LDAINILDLASVVLSFLVFYQIRRAQSRFTGLERPFFVTFSSVAILALANSILEISGYTQTEATPQSLGLHVIIFGMLLLIFLGLTKMGYQIDSIEGFLKGS